LGGLKAVKLARSLLHMQRLSASQTAKIMIWLIVYIDQD